MGLINMVLVTTDAGEQLEERNLPIPAYELGETLGYKIDPNDVTSTVEAEVIGYNIEVFPSGNDEHGGLLHSYRIQYELNNEHVLDEEDVDYSYVSAP